MPLGVIAFIISTIFIARSLNERQATLQRRLDGETTDIEFDYNRFNTADQRATSFRIIANKLLISTDVQLIQIANNHLLLQIRSYLKSAEKVEFDLMIAPFSKDFLTSKEFAKYNFSEGDIIASAAKNFEALLQEVEGFTGKIWRNAPDGAIKLSYTGVETIPSKEGVLIKGEFMNGVPIEITFYYKAFKLEILLDLRILSQEKIYHSFDLRDLE